MSELQWDLFHGSRKGKNMGALMKGHQDLFTEFADEITFGNQSNGVTFRPSGDCIRVIYDGLLAKSGAEEVFAVIGYGSGDSWQNVQTYPMDHVRDNAFELLLEPCDGKRVNVVFKDGAGNWDNNSGRNYSYLTH